MRVRVCLLEISRQKRWTTTNSNQLVCVWDGERKEGEEGRIGGGGGGGVGGVGGRERGGERRREGEGGKKGEEGGGREREEGGVGGGESERGGRKERERSISHSMMLDLVFILRWCVSRDHQGRRAVIWQSGGGACCHGRPGHAGGRRQHGWRLKLGAVPWRWVLLETTCTCTHVHIHVCVHVLLRDLS